MPEKGALARSWSLMEASWEILLKNKILMIYPLVSLTFTAAIASFFFGPGVWAEEDPALHSQPLMIAFYLVMMFGFTFTSVAFCHEVMIAFSGEAVSVRRGFAFARRRIKAILLWSLFAGLVGLLIRNLEQRFGIVGKIVLRLTGVVWSVASVFAIQVMIREESANPLELLRKSSTTLRRNWKDNLVGYVGIGVVSAVIVGAFLVAVFVGISFVKPEMGPRGGIALNVTIGLLFLVAMVLASSLDSIFRCALYIYASEGVAPAPYDSNLMDGAWKVKKS